MELAEQEQSDAHGISIPIAHVGDKIEVYWPLDNQYYPETVAPVNEDGHYIVKYADRNFFPHPKTSSPMFSRT